MGVVVDLAAYRRQPRSVFFDRRDFTRLLSLYRQHVSRGVWKDYAIRANEGMAAFAVFRRAADGPAYTVIKYAAGESGRSEYVLCRGARRLGRGDTLDALLPLIEPGLKLV